MLSDVIELYEYFCQNVSGNQFFEFQPRVNEIKMMKVFVDSLSPSHGEDWLFNYFCFQFHRYTDKKTRFGQGVIYLNWVIGQKAILKFKEASSEELYYMEQFKSSFNLVNILLKPQSIENGKDYKDRERRRFYNTTRGLLHCKENSLYSQKNKNCITCKNKTDCKI